MSLRLRLPTIVAGAIILETMKEVEIPFRTNNFTMEKLAIDLWQSWNSACTDVLWQYKSILHL